MTIFFIPLISDVTTEIFDRSLQRSITSFRKSTDGLSCILSFNDDDAPFDFINKSYGPYTKEEMQQIIDDNPNDWSD
jgi:hypothetical protein